MTHNFPLPIVHCHHHCHHQAYNSRMAKYLQTISPVTLIIQGAKRSARIARLWSRSNPQSGVQSTRPLRRVSPPGRSTFPFLTISCAKKWEKLFKILNCLFCAQLNALEVEKFCCRFTAGAVWIIQASMQKTWGFLLLRLTSKLYQTLKTRWDLRLVKCRLICTTYYVACILFASCCSTSFLRH